MDQFYRISQILWSSKIQDAVMRDLQILRDADPDTYQMVRTTVDIWIAEVGIARERGTLDEIIEPLLRKVFGAGRIFEREFTRPEPIDLDGATNHEFDEGTGVHSVTPFYTVDERLAHQWEVEVEGVRARLQRSVLPRYPAVRSTGIDFDATGHSMFATFESTDTHALHALLVELSGIGFCTGIA